MQYPNKRHTEVAMQNHATLLLIINDTLALVVCTINTLMKPQILINAYLHNFLKYALVNCVCVLNCRYILLGYYIL